MSGAERRGADDILADRLGFPLMSVRFVVLAALFGASVGLAQRAESQPARQDEEAGQAKTGKDRQGLADPAAYPFEIVDDVTQGTEPASADVTGQLGVADEDYIPEVFQYRRRGTQPAQRELSGEHRSTALTEFRVIDLEVDPGDTVRAIARVEPAFEKGRRFVAEFWSQEYGPGLGHLHELQAPREGQEPLSRARQGGPPPPGRPLQRRLHHDHRRARAQEGVFHRVQPGDAGRRTAARPTSWSRRTRRRT